jgi:thiamine-phosphate diphosphorylase/hydroxyethylthiazole kinase
LDPVGAAATEVRKNAVKELMTGGYFDLIKGNEGELKQIWGRVSGRQHGVDSGPSTMNKREKATMVQDLAQKERELQYAYHHHLLPFPFSFFFILCHANI